MGFVGTAVGRQLITRLGLLRAGMVATGWMLLLLSCAGLIYRTFLSAGARTVIAGGVGAPPVATWVFCGLVVLSRPGLWAFDMVDAQLFQTVRLHLSLSPLLSLRVVGGCESIYVLFVVGCVCMFCLSGN